MSRTSDREIVEFYKFIPSGLVLYIQNVQQFSNRQYPSWLLKENADAKPTYSGEITPHSRRRLSKALGTLIEISKSRYMISPITGKRFKFRLAFFTLTLSAPQYPFTDKDIKKNLLEPFIRIWRNKGMRHYVWRSEQQKNGNIHFHFITDTYILHTDLRNSWNNIQNRLKFVDYFEKKHGHRVPNSTDIKAVKGENETKAYLLKYMLKDEKEGSQQKLDFQPDSKQKGKIWDCSQSLKIPNKTADFLTQELWNVIQTHTESKTIEEKAGDYFKLYFYPKAQRDKIFPAKFTAAYDQYLDQVRNTG